MQAREVAAVVPTQMICLEAVSLAYPYLFTRLRHSCVFAEVDAGGQMEMPCAWPAGPPQSHKCLPCSTVPLLPGIIRKDLGSLPVRLLRDKAPRVCMHSSSNSHIYCRTLLENKHVHGSRSNPLASCIQCMFRLILLLPSLLESTYPSFPGAVHPIIYSAAVHAMSLSFFI